MHKTILTNILKKKYLTFLKIQEAQSKPFPNKLAQLNKFYLPICKKIFLDYEKKKIDLRAKLIVDLKEFMSLKKTVYLFRVEDEFRKEMMKKLRPKSEFKK